MDDSRCRVKGQPSAKQNNGLLANTTVTTAYVDDTAHAKWVRLRGLNVNLKTIRIHQRIRLYVTNSKMDSGVERRVGGEFASTQEAKKSKATRRPEHDTLMDEW